MRVPHAGVPAAVQRVPQIRGDGPGRQHLHCHLRRADGEGPVELVVGLLPEAPLGAPGSRGNQRVGLLDPPGRERPLPIRPSCAEDDDRAGGKPGLLYYLYPRVVSIVARRRIRGFDHDGWMPPAWRWVFGGVEWLWLDEGELLVDEEPGGADAARREGLP